MRILVAWWAVILCSVFFSIQMSPVSVFEGQTVKDIVIMNDITQKRVWHGALRDFPHTYEFAVTEKTRFVAEIAMPKAQDTHDTVSGILIRVPGANKRVVEVARLKTDDWSTSFDWRLMKAYRVGARAEIDLEPGLYRFEIHSANNQEMYAVQIGQGTQSRLSYLSFLRDSMSVYAVEGVSRARIVFTPAVLLVIVGIMGTVYYRKRTQI